MKITKRNKQVEEYEAKCPNCEKIFTSQSKKQLEWNIQVHHVSCKKKMEKKGK